jgi:hypothetical protein
VNLKLETIEIYHFPPKQITHINKSSPLAHSTPKNTTTRIALVRNHVLYHSQSLTHKLLVIHWVNWLQVSGIRDPANQVD